MKKLLPMEPATKRRKRILSIICVLLLSIGAFLYFAWSYKANHLQIHHRGTGTTVELTEGETEMILSWLNSGDWKFGKLKIRSDYTFQCKNTTVYYSFDNMVFEDHKRYQYLELTEEQWNTLNALIQSYFTEESPQ